MRIQVDITGAVQGVGFRPFVFRLARDLKLRGWVQNSAAGVCVEVEGPEADLQTFIRRLKTEKPVHSFFQSLQVFYLDDAGYSNFEIRESPQTCNPSAVLLPDIATCPECLREITDPQNRRYRYPFTNCTLCGPRYSIITGLPYDRASTSMQAFEMCPACRAEYKDPQNRRFHAQPNACPDCGPSLELWDTDGAVLEKGDAALRRAVILIREGKSLAVKGLGGFQLMVDARQEDAVRKLRCAKGRGDKPFAVMIPSLERVEESCEVSPEERDLLTSPETPIVLLKVKAAVKARELIASSVRPDNPYLGVMLPYTPLHHLLMADVARPIVATSGNLTDEPICIGNQEALRRLSGLAEAFLVHNRPIVRHVDDSVARVMLDRPQVVRRARGYAPLPVELPLDGPALLAVGGHLKNTVALKVKHNVYLSQHIGDLETEPAHTAFEKTVEDLQQLYRSRIGTVAADLHPDYLSTKFARSLGVAEVRVQHHHAHIAACMAENQLDPHREVLGVAWDGTGYGTDGTVWGGEFLDATMTDFRRAATLRPFRLPGGDRAVKSPWRCAYALLWELSRVGGGGDDLFDLPAFESVPSKERALVRQMLDKDIRCVTTTSMGRLFDAVASLIGIREEITFEGQAAMQLEFACESDTTDEAYPFGLDSGRAPGKPLTKMDDSLMIDWLETIEAVLQDSRRNVPPARMARKFHNTLMGMIVAVAREAGRETVVLSGGCFQNRILLEATVRRLRAEGFQPYWHQRVPPNDGGLALGQIAVCAARLSRTSGEGHVFSDSRKD